MHSPSEPDAADEEEDAPAEPAPEAPVCQLCQDNLRHPLFLYLITDGREPDPSALARKARYVGLSSQPLLHTRCQNRQSGLRAGIKVTKAVAPHWELQLVVESRGDGKAHKAACKRAKNDVLFVARYLWQLSVRQATPLFCNQTPLVRAVLRRSPDILGALAAAAAEPALKRRGRSAP